MPTRVKEAVIDMIHRMPDDASVADIMAELYIRNKVDEGLRQLDSGQLLEHEEVVSDPDSEDQSRSSENDNGTDN